MESEAELEMVRRHVREGARHVTRQREIIIELQQRGAPTEIATNLLQQFEDLQRQHKAHLSRLAARSGE